jgi:hypothetical protein
MKTQVIQLDQNDDVTSVRDKLSWAKANRVLLVFPQHARILSRTLDLRLLRRQAATLGVQLAIVTRWRDLRRIALHAGIPVFTKAAQAQKSTWEAPPLVEKPHRSAQPPDLHQLRREAFPTEAHWRSLFGFRFLFFLLAVLAVLALLLLFVPSANIRLTPATRLQTLTIPARASLDISSVSVTGSLPARLTSMVIEDSKTAAVSGSVEVPDAAASGTVRFRNLTTEVVGIPAGTVVSTTGSPPVRFATSVDAVVSAGVGKTLEISAQALEAGPSGNLPADSLVAIEGELGANLSVTNPDPTSGGADRTAPVQTASDRARLHEALLAEILSECKAALPVALAAGDVYFPDTAAIGQVLSETYFPADGQTGDTLSLTLDLQCQAHYVAAADINALAEMALDANLPDGFSTVSPETTILTAAAPVTDADGITQWEFQAQRLLQARLDPQAVAQAILGRRPAAAAKRLSASFALDGPPEIQLTPTWWPWLPGVPFRIDVFTNG